MPQPLPEVYKQIDIKEIIASELWMNRSTDSYILQCTFL